MVAIKIIPPSLSKTNQGWRVGQVYKNKNYARYYHYKGDALVFMEDLLKTKEVYGVMFHPTMLHMYEE